MLCSISDDIEKYFKTTPNPMDDGVYHGITTTYARKNLNADLPYNVTITAIPTDTSVSIKLMTLRSLNHVRFPKVYGCMVYKHTTYVVTDSWVGQVFNGNVITLAKALKFSRKSEFKRLTEIERRSIVKQLIDGLEYLHSMGYVHRNLNPDNILVSGRDNKIAIQIVGLDYMCDISNCQDLILNSKYQLPNLQKKKYKNADPAWQQLVLRLDDLWAYGQIVIELLQGYSDLGIFSELFELDSLIDANKPLNDDITAGDIKGRVFSSQNYRETEWITVQSHEGNKTPRTKASLGALGALGASGASGASGADQDLQDYQIIDTHDPYIQSDDDSNWQVVDRVDIPDLPSSRGNSNRRARGPSSSRSTVR